MRTDHGAISNWVCLACNDSSARPVFYEKSAFIEHLEGKHSRGINTQQIPMLVSAWQRKMSISIHSCPLCGFEGQDSDAILDHTAEHLHSFSLRSLPWAPAEDGSDNDVYDGCYEQHPYFDIGRSVDTESERSRSSMPSEQGDLEELPVVGSGGETTENSGLTEEKIRGISKNANVEKDMLDAFLNGIESQGTFEEPSPKANVSNLGSVFGSESEYEEAEPMHRRDLEGSEKGLGPGHADNGKARIFQKVAAAKMPHPSIKIDSKVQSTKRGLEADGDGFDVPSQQVDPWLDAGNTDNIPPFLCQSVSGK